MSDTNLKMLSWVLRGEGSPPPPCPPCVPACLLLALLLTRTSGRPASCFGLTVSSESSVESD